MPRHQKVQLRGCRHLSRPMLRHLFQWHRHAMGIAHWFWLGDCEGFGYGSARGHRSMPVHGGARSAAVRDPKVRLRGLSEIATTAPYAFSLQCTWSAFGTKQTWRSRSTMSAFGGKADSDHVRL